MFALAVPRAHDVNLARYSTLWLMLRLTCVWQPLVNVELLERSPLCSDGDVGDPSYNLITPIALLFVVFESRSISDIHFRVHRMLAVPVADSEGKNIDS